MAPDWVFFFSLSPMTVEVVFLKQWVKQHPELAVQIEFGPENMFHCSVWNPEKTRILFNFELSPLQQSRIIAFVLAELSK